MKNHEGIEFDVIMWEMRGNLDITQLNNSITDLWNYIGPPVIKEVPDTGLDNYAIVVCYEDIDPQKAFDMWLEVNYSG